MRFHKEEEYPQGHARDEEPQVSVLVEHLDFLEPEREEQAHARANEHERNDHGKGETGHLERVGKEKALYEQQGSECPISDETHEQRRLLAHVVDNLAYASAMNALCFHIGPPITNRLA